MWMKRESEDESASAAHKEKGEMPRYGLECYAEPERKDARRKWLKRKT